MTNRILFPHTHITIPDLDKILARFGELTICQPWFMKDPFTEIQDTDRTSVHIQQPPETLKPREDFMMLITEYKQWLRQNRDKGYGSFLAVSRKGVPSEDTPWEIRQLISKAGGEGHSDPHEDRIFKWHLILHLAREVEENRLEAEALLNKLKHQKSPLEGALEETPDQGFFEKTPLVSSQLQVDNYHLKQVFDAWFGLFGQYLSDEGALITLDPNVPVCALEILEPEETMIKNISELDDDVSSDAVSGQRPHHVTHLPRLADGEEAWKDPTKKGLSGRTIILMED